MSKFKIRYRLIFAGAPWEDSPNWTDAYIQAADEAGAVEALQNEFKAFKIEVESVEPFNE